MSVEVVIVSAARTPIGSFGGALSLNVLDCVPSPVAHLMELGRVLEDGAPAMPEPPAQPDA